MFLNVLSEENKKIFIDLAIVVACADDSFDPEEKDLIEAYKQEMGIEYYHPEVRTEINSIISNIVLSCTEKEKRIVVFEIIGLAKSDKIYDSREKELVNRIATAIGVDSVYIGECELLIDEYLSLHEKLLQVVLDEYNTEV